MPTGPRFPKRSRALPFSTEHPSIPILYGFVLAATLLKLFLYDLAAIGSIYRIGALLGVAVIAFVAAFLYRRFFDKAKED